jgi:hypothetical protein
MARSVRDASLDSRTARARLRVRGKPYWRQLGARPLYVSNTGEQGSNRLK